MGASAPIFFGKTNSISKRGYAHCHCHLTIRATGFVPLMCWHDPSDGFDLATHCFGFAVYVARVSGEPCALAAAGLDSVTRETARDAAARRFPVTAREESTYR